MRPYRLEAVLIPLFVTGCAAEAPEEQIERTRGNLQDNGSPPPASTSAPEAALLGEWVAEEGGLATPGRRSRLSFATTGTLTATHPSFTEPRTRSGAFSVSAGRLTVRPSTALTGVQSSDGHSFTITGDGKLVIGETMFGTLLFRRETPADAPKDDATWRAAVVGVWRLRRGCAPSGNPSRVSEIELTADGAIRVRRGPDDVRGTYTIEDGRLVATPAEVLARGGRAPGDDGVLESLVEGTLSVTWIEHMCPASTFVRR